MRARSSSCASARMVKPVRTCPASKSIEPIVQASVSILTSDGLKAGVRALPDLSLSRLRVSSAESRDLSTPKRFQDAREIGVAGVQQLHEVSARSRRRSACATGTARPRPPARCASYRSAFDRLSDLMSSYRAPLESRVDRTALSALAAIISRCSRIGVSRVPVERRRLHPGRPAELQRLPRRCGTSSQARHFFAPQNQLHFKVEFARRRRTGSARAAARAPSPPGRKSRYCASVSGPSLMRTRDCWSQTSSPTTAPDAELLGVARARAEVALRVGFEGVPGAHELLDLDRHVEVVLAESARARWPSAAAAPAGRCRTAANRREPPGGPAGPGVPSPIRSSRCCEKRSRSPRS